MAVTGYSGLFNHRYGEMYKPLFNSDKYSENSVDRIRTILQNRQGRKLASAIRQALGIATTASNLQRKATSSMNGYSGIIEYETVTDRTGALSPEDIAVLTAATDVNYKPPYPVDLSGNGGGGYQVKAGNAK